ncbi:MAG: FAD-linked oxidase C-terminal domain-containing protein [Calditrichota bacterium]
MLNWLKGDAFHQLRRKIGKLKVLTNPESLTLYGIDATTFRGNPAAVVLAETAEDVQETVVFAGQAGFTITPRGAGSGLSGGSVPESGSIVLSLERMKSLDSLETDLKTIKVRPGMVTADLQKEVLRHGLFYPPDPSSYEVSTIGGNVAENAGGLRCFKYGVTGHYVLGLEYVNGEGDLQQTGVLSTNIFEPDLTSLFVGSEGTLGIFTKIALRLIPAPETTITIAVYVASLDKALALVEKIITLGITPSVLEVADRRALTAAAGHAGVVFPSEAGSLLLLELDGVRSELDSAVLSLRDILIEDAINIETAATPMERNQLWKLRRSISPSLIRLGTGKIHEDIAVPRGRLLEMSANLDKIKNDHKIDMAVYGHAGDGNLHVVLIFDGANEKTVQCAHRAAEAVFRAAIDLGGTISGEHGIGLAKRQYLSCRSNRS